MAKSEDRFLVRESQDVSLDGEIWGAEVHTSDGSVKTYGIAGADGQAEAARKEAETAREAAETNRSEDEAARTQAETARAAAELERAAQQAKNNSDQAANNAAAQGLQVVKLNQGQYDPSTLMPTVQGEVGKLYFVPIPSQAMSALAALMDVPAGDGQDDYLEWMSIDGKWERVGMSNATLVSLTTDEIDRVAAGEQVTSESVLDGTKLTYLWAKLKTAFAAITHKHATGDVMGLDTALADKATKGELKTVQDSLDHIRAGIATVNLPARDGVDYTIDGLQPGSVVVCSIREWITSPDSAKNLFCFVKDISDTKATIRVYNTGNETFNNMHVAWVAIAQ